MPSITYKNIVLCDFAKTSFTPLHCLFILVYKMILFNGRKEPSSVNIINFEHKIKRTQLIEYKIAKKNGKIISHLRKWTKFLELATT